MADNKQLVKHGITIEF